MDASTLPVKENPFTGNYSLKSYPNPASALITISFNTNNATFAKVTLCNITGQSVNVLFNNIAEQGINTFSFDANLVEAGLYIIKLEVDQKTEYSKLIIE